LEGAQGASEGEEWSSENHGYGHKRSPTRRSKTAIRKFKCEIEGIERCQIERFQVEIGDSRIWNCLSAVDVALSIEDAGSKV
jgi:hypothetical protein